MVYATFLLSHATFKDVHVTILKLSFIFIYLQNIKYVVFSLLYLLTLKIVCYLNSKENDFVLYS